MRLRAVGHAVVVEQEPHQPGIRLGLGLRLVQMVEGLVHLLDGAKRPFHLAFRPSRRPAPVAVLRHVGAHLDTEVAHDLVEHQALGDRAVVHVEHPRPALQRAVLDGLRGHGVEQEAQRRLHVFAVDAVIFLVGHAAAVIDYAVEHQQRMAASFLEPGRALDLLQVRRAQVEVPAVIAVAGLKAHGRGHAGQGRVVEAPLLEVAVDGASGQHGLWVHATARPGSRHRAPRAGGSPAPWTDGAPSCCWCGSSARR